MATQTPVCEFGWKAVDFRLRGTDGREWSLADIRGKRATLVMYICNHCPYVKASIDRIAADCRALAALGVGAVAIMSNDTADYPEDSFDNMQRFATDHRLPFPYLLDDTQAVARAYGAVCTPDFFGFDSNLGLQYRGRLDAGRTSAPPSGAKRELLEAMTAVAAGHPGPREQIPSMGCSIKWRMAA